MKGVIVEKLGKLRRYKLNKITLKELLMSKREFLFFYCKKLTDDKMYHDFFWNVNNNNTYNFSCDYSNTAS